METRHHEGNRIRGNSVREGIREGANCENRICCYNCCGTCILDEDTRCRDVCQARNDCCKRAILQLEGNFIPIYAQTKVSIAQTHTGRTRHERSHDIVPDGDDAASTLLESQVAAQG